MITPEWVMVCGVVSTLACGVVIGYIAFYGPELINELKEVQKWLQTLCALIDSVNQQHNQHVQPLSKWLKGSDDLERFFDSAQPVETGP